MVSRYLRAISFTLALLTISTMLTPLAGVAAEDEGPAVAVSVDATALDFGVMFPGDVSEASPVTVSNTGTGPVSITLSVTDDGGNTIFSKGISVDGSRWSDYNADIYVEDSVTFVPSLSIPSDTVVRGEVSGALTVWTTAMPVPDVGFSYSSEAVDGEPTSASVRFTDASTHSPTSWLWDFGDGTSSTEQNPTHVYAAEGIYQVTLTSTNIVGSNSTSGYLDIVLSWSSFQGNERRIGYYAGDAPDTNALLWVSDYINGMPSSSVTFGEGKVFVYCLEKVGGTNQSFIAALDVTNGALLWKEPTLLTNRWGSWATPVYHDGLVFTPGDTARYASNGTPAWKDGRCLADATNGGPLVADGKVFIGNWDGHTYFAYDEKTGQQLWAFEVIGYAQGSPSYDDGKVFLTSWGGTGGSVGGLYCVRADTGELVWDNTQAPQAGGSLGYALFGSVSISGGYLYATYYNFYGNGEIYCFSEADGSLIWKRTIQRTDSTPAVYDGKVYVTGGCYGYSYHQTYCFDAMTGELIWSTTTEQDIGGWTASVVIADGKVFVGREGAWGGDDMIFGYVKLFALDANTGEVIWETDNGGGTVALCDGVVFTAGIDGRIYAYGTA